MKKQSYKIYAVLILLFFLCLKNENIYAQVDMPKKPGDDKRSTTKIENKELKWLNGVWTGEGYQAGALNQKTWTVNLKYNASTNESVIEYPTFPCSGYWKLEKADDRQAVFIEYIDKGKTLCQDLGKIIITKIDDKFVSYAYFLPEMMPGVVAFSVLEKK